MKESINKWNELVSNIDNYPDIKDAIKYADSIIKYGTLRKAMIMNQVDNYMKGKTALDISIDCHCSIGYVVTTFREFGVKNGKIGKRAK